MCRTGGPRCEYADALSNVRRKTKRSKEYQQGSVYTQRKLLTEAVNKWKSENPSVVRNHLRKREKWQTKAAPLSAEVLKKHKKMFPKKIESLGQEAAAEQTRKMYQEHYEHIESKDDQTAHEVLSYSMTMYDHINAYLRGVESRDPWEGETDIAENVGNRVPHIDKAFERCPQPEEPRTLYRHVLVPAGLDPETYAKKYWIEGERVRDLAYMSTTEDPAYIAGHLHKNSSSQYIVFQILSKQGVSLQNEEEEFRGDLQSFEKERLLPRGVNMRVIGHERKRLNVPEDRHLIHKQFAGNYSKIKSRTVTVIQLLDEQLLAS